jgi:hypothetical protein
VIPSVSRGQDMGGLVRYLVDVDPARTKNVHTDPHLVAGSPGVEAWWSGRELRLEDGRKIGRELDGPWRAHGTEVTGGHVWHCSLSSRADEGQLPDETWAEIAREVMAGMGFDDPESGVSPVRWAAIRHGLSENGNDHIHLAASLVRENGQPANVFRDYRRVQKLCRDIEQRYGLTPVAAGVSQRGLSRAELTTQARDGEEPMRHRLERTVRAVAAQSGGEGEFVEGLRSAGLRVLPRFEKGGQSKVTGYAVAVPPARGGQPVWFGGGKLAKDLSLPRLRMAHRAEWGSEAVEVGLRAWRGERARRRQGPGAAVTDERLVGYAAEYEALREQLQTVPAGDMATYGLVAHQLAGVLSAWSLAAEGSRPGPLAAAAREIGRSAQVPAHVAAKAGPVPSLRGSSLALASAAIGGRGPVGQAILLRQVVATARMVSEAHAAEQRAGEALRIAALADGAFARVRAGLPSAALSAKVAEQRRQQTAQQPTRPPVDRGPEQQQEQRTEVAR